VKRFIPLLSWLAPAIAIAQETGDRATSFQAVSGSAHEDIPGGTLLVAAYAAVLVALVLYVLYVASKQASAAREIARLEKLLADKTKKE
jgi:CcmD family protein